MPIPLQGVAGPTRVADGQPTNFRTSLEGAAIVQQLHGKYFEQTLRGNVFISSCTPLGLAIPIYTGTALAGGMPLWNPSSSGVYAVPLCYTATYASGTAAYTSVGLMARNGVGSVIATGSQITAFAETIPVNGGLGLVNSIGSASNSKQSRVKSSNAGTVTVTAGVAAEYVLTMFGLNLEAQTGTAHATQPSTYEFDGKIVVPPGTMIWVAATLASVALYAQTLIWEEIPL